MIWPNFNLKSPQNLQQMRPIIFIVIVKWWNDFHHKYYSVVFISTQAFCNQSSCLVALKVYVVNLVIITITSYFSAAKNSVLYNWALMEVYKWEISNSPLNLLLFRLPDLTATNGPLCKEKEILQILSTLHIGRQKIRNSIQCGIKLQ